MGLWDNIVFAEEPGRKARQTRKWLVYLPLPHTHIQRKRRAVTVLISPCSLFCVSPHDGFKMPELPLDNGCLSVGVSSFQC